MIGGAEVVRNWSSAAWRMLPSSHCAQSIEGTEAVSDHAAPRDGVLSPTGATWTATEILSSSGMASNGILSGETSESTPDTMVVVLELSKRSTKSAAADDRAQSDGHNTGPKLGGALVRRAETGTADDVTTSEGAAQL
jgi:hypothetical protein